MIELEIRDICELESHLDRYRLDILPTIEHILFDLWMAKHSLHIMRDAISAQSNDVNDIHSRICSSRELKK